jgi:thiamine pyrophosphokinase
MNHIAIICSGEDYHSEKLSRICKSADYIIAADGGLNILDQQSIKPDFIIGDNDSIKLDLLKKYIEVPYKIYPEDKDYTDSELAIIKAKSLEAKKISLLSGTGSYLDHSLANILNLKKYYQSDIELRLYTSNAAIIPVSNELLLKNKKGHRFSFFPLKTVKNLELKGCKYFFKTDKDLTQQDFSISNQIIDNFFSISFTEGFVILILFDKEYT